VCVCVCVCVCLLFLLTAYTCVERSSVLLVLTCMLRVEGLIFNGLRSDTNVCEFWVVESSWVVSIQVEDCKCTAMVVIRYGTLHTIWPKNLKGDAQLLSIIMFERRSLWYCQPAN